MRHSAKAVLVLVAAMVAASIGSIAPAYAATIIVHPGESIQAAIDKAHAGDTIIVEPGVYHEILEITTNDITLKGSGASERGTELAPPVGPATNDCSNDPAETIGICIAGFGGPPVSDVTVQGFYIVGFSLFGGLAFNTQEAVFQHNAAVNDGEYGFFNNSSTQGKYLFNSASGATEAGFYIGDTDDADFTMVGNYSAKNTLGVFVRNAVHGDISSNHFEKNCVGMVLLAGAPGPVTDWEVTQNQSNENNKFCPAGGDQPSLSGTGLGMVGASHNIIRGNTIWGNHPSGKTPFAGGLVLAKSDGFKANHNTVDGNVLYDNVPFDIRLKKGVGGNNTFTNNACNTSKPDGLCAFAPVIH